MPPLAFIVVLGYVYAALMGHSAQKYLPHLSVGYLLWRYIIQVMSDGSSILRSHKSFIMDGRCRITDFILRVLARAFLYLASSWLIVVGVFLWSTEVEPWRLVTMLATMPVFLMNMLWLATAFVIFGARFPDLTDLMNTIIIFGFLLTPILWFPDQAPGGTIIGTAIRLNPAFHLIEFVRAPLLGGTIESFSLVFVASMTTIGALISLMAYRRFVRYVPFWL